MSEFFLTEKDRLPLFTANLSQNDVGYLDLTGGTGYFLYKNKYSTEQTFTGNIDILGASSGYVQFQPASGNVSGAGVFYAKWRIILNGKQITFPNDSFLVYSTTEDLYSL